MYNDTNILYILSLRSVIDIEFSKLSHNNHTLLSTYMINLKIFNPLDYKTNPSSEKLLIIKYFDYINIDNLYILLNIISQLFTFKMKDYKDIKNINKYYKYFNDNNDYNTYYINDDLIDEYSYIADNESKHESSIITYNNYYKKSRMYTIKNNYFLEMVLSISKDHKHIKNTNILSYIKSSMNTIVLNTYNYIESIISNNINMYGNCYYRYYTEMKILNYICYCCDSYNKEYMIYRYKCYY